MQSHRSRRLLAALPFLLAGWVAACADAEDASPNLPGTPSGGTNSAAGSAGASSGGSGSPTAGSSTSAGSGGAAPSTAGAGGTGGGSAGSNQGGSGGSSSGGASGGSGATAGVGGTGGGGGGATSGGASGGGGTGGAAPSGTCPTTLPALAADSDNSFYAERSGIAHGVVKKVEYKAGAGKTMHVYTPPGYDTNTAATYPVLYINHGGGEGDSHWSCTSGYNCGYAGRILDNLIADGKAVPMVIAMPHTGDCANFNPPAPPNYSDPCTTQYVNDFIPYIEKTYRVKKDRHSRAIAGLSMGGLVTLNTGFAHLEIFSHVFVYSSGYFPEKQGEWETNLSAVFGDSSATNKLLNAPVYLAAGATDNALPNARAVRDILKKHDIKVLYQDSSLGHEWGNWRRYLNQTAPLLFKNTSGCD